MGEVLHYLHEACYIWLGVLALWGVYCVVMAWTRVNRKKFKNEKAMMAFLEELEEPLRKGDIDGAIEVCDGDSRALPQLIHVALINRELTLPQIKDLVMHKLQHEILGDVQVRLTWIGTIIKAAPMVGLLGTVLSMMGAFMVMSEGGGDGEGAKDAALAENIMVALSATAMGLCIAITMMITVAPVNNRIRKLEDLVSYGLTRFFEVYKKIHGQNESPPRMPPETAETRFR